MRFGHVVSVKGEREGFRRAQDAAGPHQPAVCIGYRKGPQNELRGDDSSGAYGERRLRDGAGR
ncbi:hypothetical protein EON64_00980, partial [archaeon]